MTALRFAVPLSIAIVIAGCAGQGSGPKQTVGTLGGAALGGLAGSQIGSGTGKLAAVGAGVLLGGLLGSEVGKSLDRADQLEMQRTTYRALETQPSGTVTRWHNPDSQNYGTVTPEPAYQDSAGQYCREFQQTVTVNNRFEQAYGTACRRPDGSWEIVS